MATRDCARAARSKKRDPMSTKHRAATAAIVFVLAVCAFLVGLAIDNTWVIIAAIFVMTLAAIFATAFYLQGR
jgi:membrane protein YdbS with pleckstrin-like domain